MSHHHYPCMCPSDWRSPLRFRCSHRDGQELPQALGQDMVSLFEKRAQQAGVARPVPPPRPPPGSAPMAAAAGNQQPRPPPRPPGYKPPNAGMGGGGMGANGMAGVGMGANGMGGDPNAIVFNEMGVPVGNLASLMGGGGGIGGGMMGGRGGMGGGMMGNGGMMGSMGQGRILYCAAQGTSLTQ